MRQRTIVAISLLWVGALVLLSRRWLGDVREFVVQATHPGTSSSTGPPSRVDRGGGGSGAEVTS